MNHKIAGVLPDSLLIRLTLGLLPAMAVANTLENGAAIGTVTLLTLLCTGVVLALVGRLLPDKGHVAAWLIVSCAFATAAWMALKAYFHAQYQSLGIYAPVVTLISAILGRADLPQEEGFLPSVGKYLISGVLFFVATACIGALRELFGSGALLGEQVFGVDFEPMLLLKSAPGGFLLLGTLAGVANYFAARRHKRGNAAKGDKV